jgi:hypothetical protein
MATVPNISGLTINAEEVYDVNQVIAQKLWQDENFLKLHRVVSGISKKTQILLDASAGRAGWKATGCASIVSGGMDIKMAELFWDTVTLEDTLEFCQSDLDSNFKLLVKRNAKDNFASLEDQEAINTFVMAKAYVFISEMIERYIWLGDKDAENTTDGGYVNDNVNIKYFTALDGIFKQAIAGVGTGVTKRFTIAKNALATKALQLALTDAEAFAIVKGVYDNAPDVTKLDTEAYIWVTPAVYNGYKNYLATNTLSGGGLSVFTIDGIQKVAYQGVPVVTSLFIGKEILATTTILDGESPAQATYNLPHRAIMATPDLLPIATLNEDDIKALESFYVQLDRKSYVRFDVDLDVKVVRPEYISVAY